MCESDEVDLIFICTDWLMHTPMATFAMECNKHVAIEVPAAMSVEECWQLVDTAEKPGDTASCSKIVVYDPFALMTLNMAQRGLFGEIMHVEGATFTIFVQCTLPKRAKAAITTIGEKDTASNIQAILIPLMGWAPPARYWIFIACDRNGISRVHVYSSGRNERVCPQTIRRIFTGSPPEISIGRRKHHSYPHAQREDNHASIRHIHPTSLQPPSNSMRHTGIRPKIPCPLYRPRS